MLDSCVIHEDFRFASGRFFGQSFSVYNTREKIWEQTWVDNEGRYMTFAGGMEGGNMILGRTLTGPKGNTITQRMTFYNIGANALGRLFEASTDEGTTWKPLWQIHCERKR